MSKRHQANRRKTYGRRQHEVRERTTRRHDPELLDVRVDAFGLSARADVYGYELEPATRQYRFAPAD
jgi:hypothetical protein